MTRGLLTFVSFSFFFFLLSFLPSLSSLHHLFMASPKKPPCCCSPAPSVGRQRSKVVETPSPSPPAPAPDHQRPRRQGLAGAWHLGKVRSSWKWIGLLRPFLMTIKAISWSAQSSLHNGVLIFQQKWPDHWHVFSCKQKLCKWIRAKHSLILR